MNDNQPLPNPVPDTSGGVPSIGVPATNAGIPRGGNVTTEQLAGAHGSLYVTLRKGRRYLKYASENDPRNKDKEPKYQEVDLIKIQYPGGDWKETIVRDHHKQQFPEHWRFYCENERGVIGTPIAEWGGVTVDFAESCRANSIYTVEQLAELPDHKLNLLGLEGRAVRDKALNWVGGAAGRVADEEKEKLQAEVAELRAMVGQLMEKKTKPKKKKQETKEDAISS